MCELTQNALNTSRQRKAKGGDEARRRRRGGKGKKKGREQGTAWRVDPSKPPSNLKTKPKHHAISSKCAGLALGNPKP